jgi:hypothetical protein
VLGADGKEIAGGLASSPLAMPAFFLGWIGIGVLVGLGLARRGHDRRAMTALGAGLGPLMFVVASDAVRRRERETRPLVLSPGVDHGGDLDILVLVENGPEDVRAVASTLGAVESEIGTLTLARTVGYEWLEYEADNEVVASASDALLRLWAARWFTARPRRTLVLVAVDASTAVPGRP